MESKRFSAPEKKNYEQANLYAYQIACEKLAGIKDFEEQCRRCGAEYRVSESQQEAILRYLGRPFQISLPKGEISPVDTPGEIPIREKLLIIHYFLTAKGVPQTGKMITFKELPEGQVYSPTFAQRAIRPLLNTFASEPDRLVEISARLGGYRADYGDAAVTIPAFDRVPITLVLWRGDEEFAPEGNILFDETVSDYLPTEDITVLCEVIAWKLVGFSKA